MAASDTTSVFRGALESALRHALYHLENLDSKPVAPTASLEELRAGMPHPLADEGGRFYAWVISGGAGAATKAKPGR